MIQTLYTNIQEVLNGTVWQYHNSTNSTSHSTKHSPTLGGYGRDDIGGVSYLSRDANKNRLFEIWHLTFLDLSIIIRLN